MQLLGTPPAGFQLYVMLVEVFEAEKPRARWYYVAAYGFPAIVVAVSAVVDPFSYGTKEVCWLRTDNYFIFAFVGPVIAVIIVSTYCPSFSLFCRFRFFGFGSESAPNHPGYCGGEGGCGVLRRVIWLWGLPGVFLGFCLFFGSDHLLCCVRRERETEREWRGR